MMRSLSLSTTLCVHSPLRLQCDVKWKKKSISLSKTSLSLSLPSLSLDMHVCLYIPLHICVYKHKQRICRWQTRENKWSVFSGYLK